MPRANPAHVSFSAGEVSPYLYGRTDLVKYQTGAARLENLLVLPQGPVMKRRGTRYVMAVDRHVRLVPFVFSRTDKVVMEFSDLLIRFIVNDAYVAATVVTPYTDAQINELCFAQQADLAIITHRSHPPKKLLRISNTSWTFTDMDLQDGPYLDMNDDENLILSVETVLDKIDLVSKTAVFSAGDVGKYLEFKEGYEWRLGMVTDFVDSTHVKIGGQDVYDRVITAGENVAIYHNSGGYTIAEPGAFSAYNSGAYIRATVASWDYSWARLKMNTSGAENSSVSHESTQVSLLGTVLTYGRTAIITKGLRTITATVTASSALFASTDVGRHLRMRFEEEWTWGKITAFASSTSVSVQFYAPLPRDSRDITRLADGGATADWRLGAWSNTTGWPSVVSFFEQRAVFAATTQQPQTLWLSTTDDYENHAPTELNSTVVDTNGVTWTLATPEVNEIVWLSSATTLLIGTTGGEYQGRAASTVNEPITARNMSVTRQGSHGAKKFTRSLFINSSTLFVSAAAKALFEMVYSFENDAFVTRDMTIFSEHILRDVQDIVFQEDPHKVIWALLGDGTLAGCTYMREQEVASWHRHTIASGQVEAMCVIPDGANGQNEVLYLVVNTGAGRQLEVLDSLFEPSGAAVEYIAVTPFVDAYVRVNRGGATTVTAPPTMSGLTISVVNAGIFIGLYVVPPSLIVDTGEALTDVAYGLPYTAEMSSLPLDTGSDVGTGRGKLGRIDEVGLVLINSLYFEQYNGTEWVSERLGRYSFGPVYDELFNGVTKFRPFDSYTDEQTVTVRSTSPYPFCIAALLPEHKTNE